MCDHHAKPDGPMSGNALRYGWRLRMAARCGAGHLAGAFPPSRPAGQPAPTTRLRLLRLPTDALGTNPVERVWRTLTQEVVHLRLHCFAYAWLGLHTAMQTWLTPGATDG